MNRQARRKELQELQRAERRRTREISRVAKGIEKRIENDYISEDQAVDFLTKLYGRKQ